MATGFLSPIGLILQVFSDQGVVGNGYKINIYVAGTTTPAVTYTDSTLTVPNSNPIVMQANGRFNNVSVWAPSGTFLKMVMTDASGVVISGGTIDNLPLINDVITYPQTLAEAVANVTPVNTSIPSSDFVGYVIVERYGTNTTPTVTDMTTAVTNAKKVCATQTDWLPMMMMTKCLITSSVMVDRLVDTMTSDWVVKGIGSGAGFYTNGAVTIFDSTISVTTDPKSEWVKFEDVEFSTSSVFNASYVLSPKFLRCSFVDCWFRLIGCQKSTIYAQSLRFQNCNMRSTRIGFIEVDGLYDVVFNDGVIEGCQTIIKNISTARGTNGLKFCGGCVIEGMVSSTVVANGVNGFALTDCHLESNATADFNFNAGGLANGSITCTGNYIFNPNGPTFSFGPTNDVFSGGNTVSGGNVLYSNAVQIATGGLCSVADNVVGANIADITLTNRQGRVQTNGGAVVQTVTQVTYQAAMTIDASKGNIFIVDVTNNSAFAFFAVTNQTAGQLIRLVIRNTSGGAIAVGTPFGATYKLGAAWVSPANGFNKTYEFRLDGTNANQFGGTPVDVAN